MRREICNLIDCKNYEGDVSKRFEIKHFTYMGFAKAIYKFQCRPLKIPDPKQDWWGGDTPNMMNIGICQLTKETKENNTKTDSGEQYIS